MPSTIISTPDFPFVPALPGVPPLPIPAHRFNASLPIVAAVDILRILFQPHPRWGIFGVNGFPLLPYDSVFSFEYARDYSISNYPQQQGSFQSYNKVILPYEGKMTFLISKSRIVFLGVIEAACASLQLVTIVTPELPYVSANLTHYDYHRDASSGAALVKVEVWCKEVRITAGTELSPNSANPPGPGTASGGIPATSPNPSLSSTQVPASTEGDPGSTPGIPASEGGNPQYYTPTPAAGSMDASQSVNAADSVSDGIVQPQPPATPSSAAPGSGGGGNSSSFGFSEGFFDPSQTPK